MRDLSDSSRAEDSYANGADDDIKIAIPNTGVSVGDVWRYLREWLGHDRRIGGDVTIVGDQIEITARISGGNGESFRAPIADPTPAIDAAAESIFKQTQPYRYALVIFHTKGPEAALPLLRDIAEQGSDVRERQWGYVGWTTMLNPLGRIDEAALRARQGIALDPSFGKIYSNLSDAYNLIGRSEAQLAANRKVVDLLRTPEQSRLSPVGFAHTRDNGQFNVDDLLRNDQAGVAVLQHQGTLPEYNGNARSARMTALVVLTRLGEFNRAAASLTLLPYGDSAFGSTRSTPWWSRVVTANPQRSPSSTITPVSAPPSALVSARQRFGGATQIEETVRGGATSNGVALETRPDVPRGHLRIRFASQAVHPDQGRIGPCDARTTTLPGERLAIHRCQAPSATSRSFQTRTVPTIVVSLAR